MCACMNSQPSSKRNHSSLLVVCGSFCFAGAVFWPFLRHGLRRTAPYVAASDSLVSKQLQAVRELGLADSSFKMVDLGSGERCMPCVFHLFVSTDLEN